MVICKLQEIEVFMSILFLAGKGICGTNTLLDVVFQSDDMKNIKQHDLVLLIMDYQLLHAV